MPPSFPDFNLYEELEVSSHASAAVIQAAYQRLARMYHPDTNPGINPARMARLNQAYEVLSDLHQRNEYDRWLAQFGSDVGSAEARSARRTSSDASQATSTPQPMVRENPHDWANWWGSNQRWVIGLMITLAIGLAAGYSRTQTAESNVRTQNEAARSRDTSATGAGAGPVTAVLKEFSITLDKKSAAAGNVTFHAQNKGTTPHELLVIKTDVAEDKLTVKDGAVDVSALQVLAKTEQIDAGKNGSKAAALTAGKYVLICNVPAHYAAGMHIAFAVQ